MSDKISVERKLLEDCRNLLYQDDPNVQSKAVMIDRLDDTLKAIAQPPATLRVSADATPVTDAITKGLFDRWPDPIPDDTKLFYYIEASQLYGMKCAELERDRNRLLRENAQLRSTMNALHEDCKTAEENEDAAERELETLKAAMEAKGKV